MKKILSNQRSVSGLIVVVFLLTAAFSYLYSTQYNPEISFWSKAAQAKAAWRKELGGEKKEGVTIVFGGSSTAFGIDASHASEKLDLPMVNAGLHAGMGAEVLTGYALSQAREGDTLIVMLESKLLVSDEVLTPLGVQFAFSIDQPGILRWRGHKFANSKVAVLSYLRPGALEVFSMLGKVAMRRPLYSYRIEEMKPGGLLVTDIRKKIVGQVETATSLGKTGRRLLEDLVRVAEERKIGVKFALPWAFSEEEFVGKVRRERESFLNEVEEIMPVIRELEMGVHPVREDFTDTLRHLTAEAARRRTESLVKHLRSANQ